MSDDPHDLVARNLRAISGRSASDTRRSTSALVARCWPGGGMDSAEPEAREWLRRWAPARMGQPTLTCSCAAGRCALCN